MKSKSCFIVFLCIQVFVLVGCKNSLNIVYNGGEVTPEELIQFCDTINVAYDPDKTKIDITRYFAKQLVANRILSEKMRVELASNREDLSYYEQLAKWRAAIQYIEKVDFLKISEEKKKVYKLKVLTLNFTKTVSSEREDGVHDKRALTSEELVQKKEILASILTSAGSELFEKDKGDLIEVVGRIRAKIRQSEKAGKGPGSLESEIRVVDQYILQGSATGGARKANIIHELLKQNKDYFPARVNKADLNIYAGFDLSQEPQRYSKTPTTNTVLVIQKTENSEWYRVVQRQDFIKEDSSTDGTLKDNADSVKNAKPKYILAKDVELLKRGDEFSNFIVNKNTFTIVQYEDELQVDREKYVKLVSKLQPSTNDAIDQWSRFSTKQFKKQQSTLLQKRFGKNFRKIRLASGWEKKEYLVQNKKMKISTKDFMDHLASPEFGPEINNGKIDIRKMDKKKIQKSFRQYLKMQAYFVLLKDRELLENTEYQQRSKLTLMKLLAHLYRKKHWRSGLTVSDVELSEARTMIEKSRAFKKSKKRNKSEITDNDIRQRLLVEKWKDNVNKQTEILLKKNQFRVIVN
ncbi:MAG: hypothetical protein ABUK01_06135 [Leptospirales bacterium]